MSYKKKAIITQHIAGYITVKPEKSKYKEEILKVGRGKKDILHLQREKRQKLQH